MTLALVVAMAENRVIGHEGRLPWHLPADLRRFKSLTWGHTVIQGRRTYESIGKPLPGRRCLVVSRRVDFHPEGVEVAHSLAEALEACRDEAEVFVIGGAALYREALPLAQRVYLTLVHASPPGDTWFPELPPGTWHLREEERHEPDARHAHAMTFRVYERLSPP